MTLSKELLDILACPQCKTAVVADDSHSRLICNACQLSYPVRDGIPVMLLDEASSLADQSTTKES